MRRGGETPCAWVLIWIVVVERAAIREVGSEVRLLREPPRELLAGIKLRRLRRSLEGEHRRMRRTDTRRLRLRRLIRDRQPLLDTLRDALTSGLGRLPSVRDIRCERRRAEEFWRRGDDGTATRWLVERRLLLLPVGRQQATEREPLLPVVDRSFDCGDTRGEASVLGIDQLLLLRLALEQLLPQRYAAARDHADRIHRYAGE